MNDYGILVNDALRRDVESPRFEGSIEINTRDLLFGQIYGGSLEHLRQLHWLSSAAVRDEIYRVTVEHRQAAD